MSSTVGCGCYILKGALPQLLYLFSILPVFTDLFKEIKTLDSIRNDTMPVNELSSKLLSAGIPVSNKTFQEILRQASVDGESFLKEQSILSLMKS